jgi:hypothetical protein
MDKLLEKLPSWAIAIALIGILAIFTYMLMSGTKIHVGDTTVGFLKSNEISIPIIWEGNEKSSGYGAQAWQHTTKSAACPANNVVAGIQVIYSGTCRNQCNADGGIIREIQLKCRALEISAPVVSSGT